MSERPVLCHAPASGKASCCLLCSVGLWSWWLCPESNLSLLQLITFSQKPSGQSCWPLSPVSLELLVHPPSSNKTVPVPEEGDPILLVSPSLLWDWKVNSNRFGERTVPWCHLRPIPICFGWTHLGSCQSVLEAQCCRSSRQALVCPLWL